MTASVSELTPRPLPTLDAGNRPFWTAGGDGDLVISHCADCGYWSHPPVPRCPSCTSKHMTPQPVSGKGVVYSFTVNHHAWYPTMAVPYVVAIVELDEQQGLRLTTTLIDCEIAEVSVGLPVTVAFHQMEDVWLPLFRLDRP